MSSKTLALLGGTKTRTKPFFTGVEVGLEEKKRVQDVLKGGVLSGFIGAPGPAFLGGKNVLELESLFKKKFSAQFAVSCNSATSGLHMALVACGIQAGDEVIVPPYTMSATAMAVLMVNATPVFVDIDQKIFCIDPAKIEKAITKRTKAIVVVHLFGHPAPMNEIMKIAKRHHLKVLEDVAQAPAAIYHKKYTGTIGDIGVFSLNQNKVISSGEGGVCITNNKNYAALMQLVRNHGENAAFSYGTKGAENIIGYNYRMTELEAACAIGQFKRLDQLNAKRIQLAALLTKKLSGFKGLTLPQVNPSCKSVYFCYVIRYNAEEIGISRSLFIKALQAEGVPFGMGYVKPLYTLPIFQKNKKRASLYRRGVCPVVERMHEKEVILTFACRQPHTVRDIDDIAKAFRKIYDNLSELKKLDING